MKKRVLVIAALVSGALAVSGCTTNPYTGEREAGKSGIGAGIGSLVGAGVGALSSSKKDRGKGALIGAAAGAALGGGVGYYMDVQEAKLRDKMKGTGVSVTRSGDNIIVNMPNNVTFDSSSATLKPAGADTVRFNTLGDERAGHGIGTLLGQTHVQILAASAVSVTHHVYGSLVVLFQYHRHAGQGVCALSRGRGSG